MVGRLGRLGVLVVVALLSVCWLLVLLLCRLLTAVVSIRVNKIGVVRSVPTSWRFPCGLSGLEVLVVVALAVLIVQFNPYEVVLCRGGSGGATIGWGTTKPTTTSCGSG